MESRDDSNTDSHLWSDHSFQDDVDRVSDSGSYDDSVFAVNEEDFRVVEEYRTLVKLFRELPKDMCVAQFLQNFASCEQDLERVRDYYFEHLKRTCDDFPYGQDSSLKRRMFTRTGDPVAVRLAYDIYNIIDVTEGADPAILKSMLSTGQKAKRVSLACGGRSRSRRTSNSMLKGTSHKCMCNSEVKILKDTVATLQADVLIMKQSVHMGDKLRSEQYSEIRSSMVEMKQYLLNCSSSIKDITTNTVAAIRNVSHLVMEQVIAIEDRVRLLEALVELHIGEATPLGNTDAVVGEDAADDYCDLRTDEDFESYMACPAGDNTGQIQVRSASSGRNETTEQRYRDPTGLHTGPNDVGQHPLSKPQVSVNNVNSTRVPVSRHQVSANDVNNAHIPVLVTNSRNSDMYQDGELSRDRDGFNEYRRKRTRHFCVLGLSRKVDINILSRVIRAKGPTITNIRVFPCRRNPSKVVIRLNLVADDYSNRVMNEGFWPHYVTCKPWVSQNRASQGPMRPELPPRLRASQKDQPISRFNSKTEVRRNTFANYNRYQSLTGGVD